MRFAWLPLLAAALPAFGTTPQTANCFGTMAGQTAPSPHQLSAELEKLLVDLVQAPSVNGVHPEQPGVEILEAFGLAHGIQAEKFFGAGNRPVLLLSAGPETAPALLMVAHSDTTPAGDPAKWTYPPFSATVADGKLYGRGAIDNKGGAVAAMGALLKIKAEGKSRGLLAYVPDEEAGATGELGIKLLHKLGKLKAAGAIYTYPGMDKIILGHRGLWRFKLVVTGEGMHTGSSGWQQAQTTGNNPLLATSELALKLEEISLRLAVIKGAGLFDAHSTVVTPAVSSAGENYGALPDRSELKVDVRTIPETDLESLRREVRAAMDTVAEKRPGLMFELVEEYFIPPTQIPAQSAIVKAAQAATLELLGKNLPLRVSGPANESYLINERGIFVVVLGPEGKGAHSKDEYVVLGSVETAARLYFAIAQKLAASPN